MLTTPHSVPVGNFDKTERGYTRRRRRRKAPNVGSSHDGEKFYQFSVWQKVNHCQPKQLLGASLSKQSFKGKKDADLVLPLKELSDWRKR